MNSLLDTDSMHDKPHDFTDYHTARRLLLRYGVNETIWRTRELIQERISPIAPTNIFIRDPQYFYALLLRLISSKMLEVRSR
jgi:hypothetical protein